MMSTARRLLLANFALGFYNVGTVWLTQVTCYPLWANVGRAEWPAYHLAWWRSIQGVTLGRCWPCWSPWRCSDGARPASRSPQSG
jgi:hypothetical protein